MNKNKSCGIVCDIRRIGGVIRKTFQNGDDMYKTVDVVIPTYKPDDTYIQLLKRLAVQDYPITRIIVMNTNEEYYHAKEYPVLPQLEVHHVDKSEFDHGATRDLGISYGCSEIIICMTQDAMPCNRQLIRRLVEAIDEDDVAAAYARQLPARDCAVIERYTRKFNYPAESRIKGREELKTLGIKSFFCSNVCAAYRRDVYEANGGFISRTIFNEDMIYAGTIVLRGYKVAYQADARVIHSHNYTGMQQLRRNFDLGVSQADHPEVFVKVEPTTEGGRLVKDTAMYLLRSGHPLLLPKLVYISACKFIGYAAGKNYKRLPGWLIQQITMNKEYWER